MMYKGSFKRISIVRVPSKGSIRVPLKGSMMINTGSFTGIQNDLYGFL